MKEWQDRLDNLYEATQQILFQEVEDSKDSQINNIKERLEKMEEKRLKHEEKMKEHKKYAELKDEISQTKKLSDAAASSGMTVRGTFEYFFFWYYDVHSSTAVVLLLILDYSTLQSNINVHVKMGDNNFQLLTTST